MKGLRTVLLLAAVGLTGSAGALMPALSAAQTVQARQAGEAMSITEGGYQLGNYLLKQYNADVILRPNSPEVDGIVLSTPFERVRYEAYLAHLENKPLTDQQAQTLARSSANQLSFRIYTHSPYAVDEEEEQWQQAYKKDPAAQDADETKSYLDFFKAATLTVGGRTYKAQPVIDGPYVDNFTLPSGKATFRNLGVVHYTFKVPGMPNTGAFVLDFRDSQGKAYRITGNLGQHQ